jgi:hypothetical protein
MVRTELLPEYIGRVFIPPHLRGNYSDLPHKVFMWALVIATGPECSLVKVGDRVGFSRLFFARWQYLDDKTLVGWVLEPNLAWVEAGDEDTTLPAMEPDPCAL